jgi:ketosteroid isomerase-like protein
MKEIIQGMYFAFAAGDVETVVASMTEDIVWNMAENFPYSEGNPYVGPEAVVNGIFARLATEWEYWHVKPEEMLAEGDKVVAFGRYEAKNKETGKTLNAQLVHVWTLVDGKAARFQQYADTAQAQAAMRADGG